MSEAVNNWNLFGLDLSRSGKWVSLGLKQLFYDHDAWLFKRFDPVVHVMQRGEKVAAYQADRLLDSADEDLGAGQTSEVFQAVMLPSDAVLMKSFSLPSSSEEDLDVAMHLESGLSSPFTEDETRAAWRVTERHYGVILVTLAITSQSAIELALQDSMPGTSASYIRKFDVWAIDATGTPLVFQSTGERNTAYRRSVARAGFNLLVAWLMVMFSIALLAGAWAVRANQLGLQLEQVGRDASAIAAQREVLQSGRASLSLIHQEKVASPDYRYWLHHIAASAPDTVYLDRLSFEGNQVSVNGYSNNASSYLRVLTETPGYTDVSALSAFSRDRNSGLERFSIRWQIEGPQRAHSSSVDNVVSGAGGEGQ